MKTNLKLLSSKVDKSTKNYRDHVKGADFDKNVNELTKIFEPLGFTFLSVGIERVGFLYKDGKTVLKVTVTSDTTQNKHEIEFVKQYLPYIPEELHKHFVLPIAWASDYSWLLVPKADTSDAGDLTMEEAMDISREMQKIFCLIFDDIDFHDGNVGKLNGIPVIIDFGFLTFLEKDE